MSRHRLSRHAEHAVPALVLAALFAERAHARTAFARRQAMAEAMIEEHAALHAVAALVARGDELPDVCARVAESAATLLGGKVALVLRFHERGGGRLVGRWVRDIDDYPEPGEELPFSPTSAIGTVLMTGKTAWVAAATPSRFQSQLGERVATPISIAGRVWGALAVGATQEAPLASDSGARIERFAELVALAIGNAEARAQLVVQARTDSLTGIANHRTFRERLAGEVALARSMERPLSLIVFDVDRFKSVNDGGGHLCGDAVLTAVAHRLAATVRPDSLVARLGGDEFAAVLPGCDGEAAHAVAERARHVVAAHPIDGGPRVTLSAGVSDLDVAGTAEELLERADDALYRAKASGRDACVRYALDISAPADHDAPRIAR